MIGALSIFCGVVLLYLLFSKNEKYEKFLHPDRRQIATAIAALFLLLGGAEFFVPEGIILLTIRIIIGLLSFGLSWVIQAGLIQSSAMLMALLIIIRAMLIHFDFKP